MGTIYPLQRAPENGPWPCPPLPLPHRAQPLGKGKRGNPKTQHSQKHTLGGVPGLSPEGSWRPRLGSDAQTSQSSEKKAEEKIAA